MKFKKYQCLENDFIIVENELLNVYELCDQHKGIGADGLIVILKDNILFFNKDGTKANFCGNGIRCAAKYIVDNINENQTKLKFEGKFYNITNKNNFYKLKFNISEYKKIKNFYLVNSGVDHLVVFSKPSIKKANKLFKKYNVNITFYHNKKATTFEKGVGFTRGCGSGLISIMSILYKEKKITSKTIYSHNSYSNLEVKHNSIYLESEVFYVYKGEI
ncbi:MAG: hypothetical protein R3Y60_01205 [bacterium]